MWNSTRQERESMQEKWREEGQPCLEAFPRSDTKWPWQSGDSNRSGCVCCGEVAPRCRAICCPVGSCWRVAFVTLLLPSWQIAGPGSVFAPTSKSDSEKRDTHSLCVSPVLLPTGQGCCYILFQTLCIHKIEPVGWIFSESLIYFSFVRLFACRFTAEQRAGCTFIYSKGSFDWVLLQQVAIKPLMFKSWLAAGKSTHS